MPATISAFIALVNASPAGAQRCLSGMGAFRASKDDAIDTGNA
jgi:hypothetical protein